MLPYVAHLILLGVLVAAGLLETQSLLYYALISAFFIASAYYVRTIPSLRLWRTIWIVAGAGVFGFPLFVALIFVLGKTLMTIVDTGISVIVALTTSLVIGALIGDRFCKNEITDHSCRLRCALACCWW